MHQTRNSRHRFLLTKLQVGKRDAVAWHDVGLFVWKVASVSARDRFIASRTVLFLREATRAVRRPSAARDEVHAREREMDERDAHVCDTTEIRRSLIECHFHSAHNVGTSILKLGPFYRRFRVIYMPLVPQNCTNYYESMPPSVRRAFDSRIFLFEHW